MSKYFVYVSYGDSNKKLWQFDLVLETFWVTQCGWIRLCTTVDMLMTIINCWKLFHYMVKRDKYDELISTIYLLEQIALGLFNNPF